MTNGSPTSLRHRLGQRQEVRLAVALGRADRRLAVLWWSLPLTAGYLLAVPFAVVTAEPAVGATLQRLGICGIPEDFRPPPEITAARAAVT